MVSVLLGHRVLIMNWGDGEEPEGQTFPLPLCLDRSIGYLACLEFKTIVLEVV